MVAAIAVPLIGGLVLTTTGLDSSTHHQLLDALGSAIRHRPTSVVDGQVLFRYSGRATGPDVVRVSGPGGLAVATQQWPSRCAWCTSRLGQVRPGERVIRS